MAAERTNRSRSLGQAALVVAVLVVLAGCAPPIVEVHPSSIQVTRESEPYALAFNNCEGTEVVDLSIVGTRRDTFTVELTDQISVDLTGTAMIPGMGKVDVGSEVAHTVGRAYGEEVET